MPVAARILWVDDEMDSLKSHAMFLTSRGYEVHLLNNGQDAIDRVRDHPPDIVLLDESMPGIGGLETLGRIKALRSTLPVVMVTKNEAENVMDDAIGRQIDDYLIKPVNPAQVVSCLKKLLDNKRLVSQTTTTSYIQEFSSLGDAISSRPDADGWKDIYNKLVFWEMEMDKADSSDMRQTLQKQKEEANAAFFRFISSHYAGWVAPGSRETPLMSHTLMERKILPILSGNETPVVFLLLDNLRLDQWRAIEPVLSNLFNIVSNDSYYSILPTATQYARNALFSGMLPVQMAKTYPDCWKNDEDEGSKNQHEEFFFRELLNRKGIRNLRTCYHKILSMEEGKQLENNALNLLNHQFSIVVYNFVDMVSHAHTEMELIKHLASDERSYRSLIRGWFEHSSLFSALRKLSEKKVKVVLTTDHGCIRVKKSVEVVGDRQSSSNLRYKHGRNLKYNEHDVLAFRKPADAGLPAPHISSSYIFAREDRYLIYPQHYNQYAQQFQNSFQHGGISLEEMIVPLVVMESR